MRPSAGRMEHPPNTGGDRGFEFGPDRCPICGAVSVGEGPECDCDCDYTRPRRRVEDRLRKDRRFCRKVLGSTRDAWDW